MEESSRQNVQLIFYGDVAGMGTDAMEGEGWNGWGELMGTLISQCASASIGVPPPNRTTGF